MKKSDFWYELPEELIAQTPLEDRASSRLLILDKHTGEYSFDTFRALERLLAPGDLLVMNDSRVIPARLIGTLESGREAELVLLHETEGEYPDGKVRWECLVRPGKKLRPGASVSFGNGELTGHIEEITEGGNRIVRFEHEGIFLEVLEHLGRMPLPPYIKEKLEDPERYQTVYSKHPGSAAAPTAGLHFTEELLASLAAKGVEQKFVTLHVGLGTFRPVKEDEIEDHLMHSEFCVVPEDTAAAVTAAKREGRRVIAVGTTSCRTLEAFGASDGTLKPASGWTDIFIYPGYRFKIVDALITNFHLPESTLVMLVSALAGREHILNAYAAAVRERMRFFSFGDAMFIQ